VVSDTNPDLIMVWLMLKELGAVFIDECKVLFIPENNSPDRFYELREEFNTSANQVRKAALFIYLNRHCFNGLCRYNAKGIFNTPFGKYEKPYFPDKELTAAINLMPTFDIYSRDFQDVFGMVEAGDVVYCDPPYIPMSNSAHFVSYSAGGFRIRDQAYLMFCAEQAAAKGATVIMSNQYSALCADLYSKATIHKVKVSRPINSKADKRGKVEEVIAVFNKSTVAKTAA
jgi:DNA adenine methylase